jgi:hypothetical protein
LVKHRGDALAWPRFVGDDAGMTADDTATDQPRPIEVRPHSRTVRVFASWKIWLPALLISLAAIAAVILIPIYRRWQAMEYFKDDGWVVGFSGEDDWFSEWFGDAGKGLRRVERLHMNFNDESLSHAAALDEVVEIQLFGYEPVDVTARGMHSLHSLIHLEEIDIRGQHCSDDLLVEIFATRPAFSKVTLWRAPWRRDAARIVTESIAQGIGDL